MPVLRARDPSGRRSATVHRERTGAVSVITLDDPGSANALTPNTIGALLGALADERADGTRCVVLTGRGSAFCAGGDASMLSTWQDWEPLERANYLESGPHALGSALRDGGFATVAAVNGAAYGAGMDIALACDVRIASRQARFCQAYVNVGVIPGDGGAWLLPRMIGHGRALELLLTGAEVDADEALEWGIVTHLSEPDRLLDDAMELAQTLASRPPTAQRMTRDLVFAAVTQSWPEHLEAIRLLMAAVGGSREHREAFASVTAARRRSR
jgi:enoyl-CoA hydratase/carnithine racemase